VAHLQLLQAISQTLLALSLPLKNALTTYTSTLAQNAISFSDTATLIYFLIQIWSLYQEQAVFGKIKMDPAKRAQTQNVGEV
jgi:hypothetical protein